MSPTESGTSFQWDPVCSLVCDHCQLVWNILLTCLGNLPTEKVTKRDIFHRFFRHGQLAQISIKQAYGFVQFLDAGACAKALAAEQGQQVRGRKMRE